VALAPYVRPVGAALACGTRPARRYWGDCSRRAAEYAHARGNGAGPPRAGPALVHGTCRAGRLRWGHAWVALPGGLAFDGVRQRFYEPTGYHRVLQTTAEASYRRAAAVAWLRATQRYGPWPRGARDSRAGAPGPAGSSSGGPTHERSDER
jgi:hypothetical protein